MPQNAVPYQVGSHLLAHLLPPLGPKLSSILLLLSPGKGEQGLMHMCTCSWYFLLRRRILWLNIRGQEAAIWSMFHFSTPQPQVSGCVVVGQLLGVTPTPVFLGVLVHNPGSLRLGGG